MFYHYPPSNIFMPYFVANNIVMHRIPLSRRIQCVFIKYNGMKVISVKITSYVLVQVAMCSFLANLQQSKGDNCKQTFQSSRFSSFTILESVQCPLYVYDLKFLGCYTSSIIVTPEKKVRKWKEESPIAGLVGLFVELLLDFRLIAMKLGTPNQIFHWQFSCNSVQNKQSCMPFMNAKRVFNYVR